jgi:hypothetical protein
LEVSQFSSGAAAKNGASQRKLEPLGMEAEDDTSLEAATRKLVKTQQTKKT